MNALAPIAAPVFVADGVLISISAGSRQLLEANTRSGLLAGAVLLDDGRFQIHVDREVYDGLIAVSTDLDRAIALLSSKHVGHA